MGETNPTVLETVVEELDGEKGHLTNRAKMSSNKCVKNNKFKKVGKHGKTRKVVVKIPSANSRKEDIENKVFPKGSEGLKRTLEEIKEDAEDAKEKSDTGYDVIDGGVPIEGEVKTVLGVQNAEQYIQTPQKNQVETTEVSFMEDLTKTNKHNIHDHVYGSFSRTDTERSLFGNQSDVTIPSLPSSSRRTKSRDNVRRSKSVGGWSKKDLELFLPRKTFFSVHDNTLSKAGFDIRSDEERKRPDWRNILRMRTMDELHPPEQKEDESQQPITSAFDSEEDDEEYSLENIVTSISAESGKDASPIKRKIRQSMKKALATDKEEYRPLYDYLKYIHDNPDEYIQMSKYTTKNSDHRHPDTLVRLGRAFRRGHQGAVRHNIYLHALWGLKPKYVDSTNQRPVRGDKGGAKKDGNDNVDQVPNSEETEIEKLKRKAENWMKPLSSQQFLKAKEMSLKDVGEEDVNMSKWWMAFKTCHYLRVPQHMSDSPS